MKIAVAQIECVLGDLEKNIKKHVDFCDEAIGRKAELIVFPELSLTGYSLKDINVEIAIDPRTTKLLDKLKQMSKKISIVCGLAEEGDNYAIYNSAVFISEGDVKFTHRKIYPPTYGLFEEFRYFSRGNDCRAHETKFGKLALLVCEDLWHMSLPYIAAMDGAKVIIGIAASPTKLAVNKNSFSNYDINTEQHRAYSRLLSTYLVFSNRVGYEDGVNFWGGSEVLDPFGNVIALAKFFEEDMIYADIDLSEVKRARQQARHFLDEDAEITLKNLVRTMRN
jgi:predicted amidohydrolase